MRALGNGDGVLRLVDNPVHMHVGRGHHKGIVVIFSWSERQFNLGGAFFVSRFQDFKRIASICTHKKRHGFTHIEFVVGMSYVINHHKAVLTLKGLFNFHLVEFMLKGGTDGYIQFRHGESVAAIAEFGEIKCYHITLFLAGSLQVIKHITRIWRHSDCHSLTGIRGIIVDCNATVLRGDDCYMLLLLLSPRGTQATSEHQQQKQ